MTTKIEFHVLQSFPPSNLNRDDTNMPKDCEFGGVRRARISSQCIKRAIRLHPDFQKQTEVSPADRTRRLISSIHARLVKAGKDSQEAMEAASNYVEDLLGGLDKKKETEAYARSKVLFYISQEEQDKIAQDILAHWEERGDKTAREQWIKAYVKEFEERTSAPDIALFGRMLADEPKLNMEASCQVAHAISTHRVNMEMDFFTAVDDLQTTDDAGAGMMGVTGFNSATFYRYAAIDLGQLSNNLAGDNALVEKTVRGFIYALAKAVPTGKQNAFAAQTPPALILAVVREDGQAWSLANAFEKPVQSDHKHSILQNSVIALDQHWQQLGRAYGDPQQPVKAYTLLLDPECELSGLQDTQVDSLHQLADTVCAGLPKE